MSERYKDVKSTSASLVQKKVSLELPFLNESAWNVKGVDSNLHTYIYATYTQVNTYLAWQSIYLSIHCDTPYVCQVFFYACKYVHALVGLVDMDNKRMFLRELTVLVALISDMLTHNC